MSLNKEQERAVRTTEGRLLVLAGAGSGKTRVIVHRIAFLIQDRNVPPQAIVGLTFTNKAAAEMRERVTSLLGSAAAHHVTLATFHSFCMQLLRREIDRLGYTRNFSLYDERDMERLLQHLTRDMLGCEGELPSLSSTRAALAKAMQAGGPQEHTWRDPFSRELFHRLQPLLRAYNAVSFDHLIHLAIRLFEEHPDVLNRYQERYRYLMIDEYQDTNPAQFRLAELLASKYQNLCVVGDDDQSIYGWRGAEVNHILRFRADSIVKLEQNYRSAPAILEAANAVISHNRARHEKKLWSALLPSEPIEIFHAPTEGEEAQAVVERLIRLREKEGLSWRDMAILYRSNALSRALELALLQASWQKEGHWVRGIPYEVFGGVPFSERSEIKDLMAYLRAIANSLDGEALLRILNVPRRGISDAFLTVLTEESRKGKMPLWELLTDIATGKRGFPSFPRGVAGISSFVELIQKAKNRFSKPPLAESLIWFLEEVDYKKAIAEEVKSEKMRAFKWENVQECVNALSQYEVEEPAEEMSLQHFISHTSLERPSFANHAKKRERDGVQLMTFHSAKGLEFPACFLVGLEEKILPHEKGMIETGIEEERRLFYVGLTRAKKFLTLSMARSRMRMGKTYPTEPSRFLFEIPKHLFRVSSHKLLH